MLDDYPLLTRTTSTMGWPSCLTICCRGCTLVIASRADPPLPLARLRARGEILEIRAEDLRFSAARPAGISMIR